MLDIRIYHPIRVKNREYDGNFANILIYLLVKLAVYIFIGQIFKYIILIPVMSRA